MDDARPAFFFRFKSNRIRACTHVSATFRSGHLLVQGRGTYEKAKSTSHHRVLPLASASIQLVRTRDTHPSIHPTNHPAHPRAHLAVQKKANVTFFDRVSATRPCGGGDLSIFALSYRLWTGVCVYVHMCVRSRGLPFPFLPSFLPVQFLRVHTYTRHRLHKQLVGPSGSNRRRQVAKGRNYVHMYVCTYIHRQTCKRNRECPHELTARLHSPEDLGRSSGTQLRAHVRAGPWLTAANYILVVYLAAQGKFARAAVPQETQETQGNTRRQDPVTARI